jgi:acetyl esterase/lipase
MTDVMSRPAPDPTLTVSYGPLDEHIIDLWLPCDTPAPLIVLLHGGFWRQKYDRTHLGPMAHALSATGYVVAVPEYRRVGMAPDWTATFDDVAAALDRVSDLAAAHGADTERVTWAGHSAGGHLVLWAAARPYFAADSPWHGRCAATNLVSLAGCNSLLLCAQWRLGDGAVLDLLGGTPEEVPDRYATTDPATLPRTQLPVALVHGSDDDTVPFAMTQAFAPGRVVEIPGAGHFDLIDPMSAAWPTVLAALRPGDR